MKAKILTLALSICFASGLSALAGDYVVEKDIPYHEDAGDYARQRCFLDFYYPSDTPGFATLVWFHGGGLVGGSKEIPEGLRDSGFGIIGVNYRLMPQAGVQECIDDAAAAVAWAFREVASRGGDPEKIFVGGHSAGGYLTDMLVLDKSWLAAYGIDSDRIAGAFPYSAQVMTHFNVRAQQGVGPLDPRIDETAPIRHMRKLPVPMLVLSGDRELELYGRYEEQAYFWRMMKLLGNEDLLHYEFPGCDHSGMARPAHFVTRRYIRALANIPAQHKDTLRVLAIGNSFSEDAVEQNLYEIASTDGTFLIIGNLYIGGCSLERHAGNVREDKADYRYRKISADGVMTTEQGVSISTALADESWDCVSFQQASHFSGMWETYEPYMGELYEYVRSRTREDVRLLWQQTWAYDSDSDHGGFANYGRDQKQMYARIGECSSRIAAKYGLEIIPSGPAVQIMRDEYGYRKMTRDGFHMSYDLGRYLLACVWYEVLSGRSPVGNTWMKDGLRHADRYNSQCAAHKAVSER